MKNTVKNSRLLSAVSALLVVACMLAMTVCAFAEAPASSESFVMEYPEDMQALGFTEPLVLDSVPQRIVCLSASPVLALYEMGANLVGIPPAAWSPGRKTWLPPPSRCSSPPCPPATSTMSAS